jgi:hypothetical protein
MDSQLSALPNVSEKELVTEEEDSANLEGSERFRTGNIIYEETFEGSNPLSQYVTRQLPEDYSFSVVTSPVLDGQKSGRFELRRYDRVVTSTGVRAEVLFQQELLDQLNNEGWYSFALYAPSSYSKDWDVETLSQWRTGSNSASLAFETAHDKFMFRILEPLERFDLGPIAKNTWHEFVFHIKHSTGPDGLVEVWHNGKKVVTRTGKNSKSSTQPNWKIGIYKPTWQNRSTDVTTRVLYYENVKIGNRNATYEEMRPLNGNTSTIDQPITSPSTEEIATEEIAPDVISPSPEISGSGLVGLWKMDEGDGNKLIDHSGLNGHASIIQTLGVAWVDDSRGGKALSLPGTLNRFASVPHNSLYDIKKNITISAWVRPNLTGSRMILSKGWPNGFYLSTFTNGKFEFRLNPETDGSTYKLQSLKSYPTDGRTWMHVAITFDGSKSTIYINGIADNSATYSPSEINYSATPLQIGARKDSNRWSGDLDDVRVYNRALSAGEIENLAKY